MKNESKNSSFLFVYILKTLCANKNLNYFILAVQLFMQNYYNNILIVATSFKNVQNFTKTFFHRDFQHHHSFKLPKKFAP